MQQGFAKWFCCLALSIDWIALGTLSEEEKKEKEKLYEEYDNSERQIQPMSQKAGMLMSQGRVEEAYAALDGARKYFRAAQKILPDEPQAYLTLATTMLNANKLDESYYLWKGAHKRVSDGHVKAWVEGRMRWTRYGKVSMQRDAVYAKGQGNLTRALELMDKQLNIYPNSPGLLLDRGTARTMISEVMIFERGNASWTDAVVADFAASHDFSFHSWRIGLLERGRGENCTHESRNGLSGSLVFDWVEHFEHEDRGALEALDFVVGSREPVQYGANGAFKDWGGYVARFKNVGLSGPDGVIVDESHCNLFIPSAGSIMNLPMDLQMLDTWAGPPLPTGKTAKQYGWFDFHRGRLPSHGQVEKARTLKKAAAVVQLADTSHFHTLTEVFGRLWLLKKHGVFEDPAVKLIVPKDPRGAKGFLSAALSLFAPDLLESKRVQWWRTGNTAHFPDVSIRAKTLFYANWQTPAGLGADGGHGSTPRSVLTSVRSSLLSNFATPLSQERSLILTLRRNTDMRNNLTDEGYLRQQLADVATSAMPQLAFEPFDGKLSAAETIASFSKARGVVGVHGGALANILFCPLDAIIFEIGFRSPFAGHYRHVAAALGMIYLLLRLKVDERGMGAHDVDMLDPVGAIKTIRNTLLGTRGEPDSGGRDEF